jgi:glycerol kinase
MTCVIAIDAGTTGVRAFAVDASGTPRARAYREFPQHFPQPGWVEHDADDIWRVTVEDPAEVAAALDAAGETVAAIRHTNQRETVVVWDRRPADPGTGRSSGRTAAPPRAATSCAPPGTSR